MEREDLKEVPENPVDQDLLEHLACQDLMLQQRMEPQDYLDH